MPYFSQFYFGPEFGLIFYITIFIFPQLIQKREKEFIKINDLKNLKILILLLKLYLVFCIFNILYSINWMLGDWIFEITIPDDILDRRRGILAVVLAYLILYSQHIMFVISTLYGLWSFKKLRFYLAVKVNM